MPRLERSSPQNRSIVHILQTMLQRTASILADRAMRITDRHIDQGQNEVCQRLGFLDLANPASQGHGGGTANVTVLMTKQADQTSNIFRLFQLLDVLAQ